MTASELEKYLHDHIPITVAMGVTVVEMTPEIVLAAPLAPNVNHRNTAFGGSIGALATLSAWSWLHADSQSLGFPVRLVVQSNQVEYLSPIEGDFVARCPGPMPDVLDRYRDSLHRRGKGRIELGATVEIGGTIAATFRGTFVAIRHNAP